MTDDDLLTPRPAPANDRLKSELLARTSRRVRLAGRMCLLGRVGIGAACFTAGVGTTFLRPKPEPRVEYVRVVEPPAAPGAPAPKAEPPLTPADLELAAEQAAGPAEAARRFREAGDRYLREYADYPAALRCYRNFLDEADPADRAAAPTDTWLLTSLKRAREQESTQ